MMMVSMEQSYLGWGGNYRQDSFVRLGIRIDGWKLFLFTKIGN